MATLLTKTANTTPASTDITYVVDDPAGTPIDNRVALGDIVTKAHGLGNGVVKIAAGTMAVATAGTDYSTPSSTEALTNKTFDANGTGNSLSNVEVADLAATAVVTSVEGLASSDNDTSLPTTAAVIDGLATKQDSGATLTSLEALALAQGDLLYATAADTLARLPKGTAAQQLRMNAGATAPEWATISASGQTTYNIIIATSGGDYATLNAYFTAGATAGDRVLVRDSHALTASISSAVANLTIHGQGKNDVVIDLSSGYSLTLSGANVTLRDIGFSCGASASAKLTLSGDYHLVDNINIASAAVHADTFNSGGNYGCVTNNNFVSTYAGTGTSGVFCYWQSQYGHYTNNYVTAKATGSTASTAMIRTSSYAQISTNFINVNASSGADTYCMWAAGNGLSITGNTFYSAAATTQKPQAIIVNGSYQAITGNSISGAWQNAVKVTSSTNVVTGNMLYTTHATGAEAVFIDSAVDNVTVVGNYIEGWSTGVHINASTCDSVVVGSNNIINVSTPISDGGTGTVMHGNSYTNSKQNNEYHYMANTSGSAMSTGQVVVWKADSSGTQVTTTTTAGNDKVYGVMIDSPNNGSSGRVLVKGHCTSLKVNGTSAIAVGDFLTTYTTAGIAAKAAAGDMCFAMALDAYSTADSLGVISCIVFSPRLI